MNRKQLLISLLASVSLCGCQVQGESAGSSVTPEPEETEETAAVETPVPEETPEVYHASLFVTGDGLLHESVYTDAMNDDGTFDFGKQLDDVLERVSGYDLAYYNQETILGGTELGLSGYPVFNSPQEFGEYMTDKGFNLVSTANNHCLDKGWAGVSASREFWNSREGVLMQGTNTSQEEYDEIAVKEVNGISVAFLSYCEHTNGIEPDYDFEVNYYPGHVEEMLEKVRRADEECDVVIVAMHWGTEYSHEVNDEQFSLAQQLADAGADVIVGNHVHVIQPFQWVDGVPVFYAMGNLVSSQIGTDRLIGMIGGMDITKTVEDGESVITIDNVRADLVYTDYVGDESVLRTDIHVFDFSDLTDDILPGHEEIYEEYTKIIKALDENIEIGGV